jgi:hypothetical protein
MKETIERIEIYINICKDDIDSYESMLKKEQIKLNAYKATLLTLKGKTNEN